MFKQYSTVRVVKLLRSNSDYDDWKVNQRPPAIGDTGILIDFLHTPNLPDRYVVESAGPNGAPIWLCDFEEGEIESISE